MSKSNLPFLFPPKCGRKSSVSAAQYSPYRLSSDGELPQSEQTTLTMTMNCTNHLCLKTVMSQTCPKLLVF